MLIIHQRVTQAETIFMFILSTMKDQEHYMLFDIIERVASDSGGQTSVGNRGLTKRADNLNKVVYGANRFFGEGTGNLAFGLPTGKGSARNIKNTIVLFTCHRH